MTRIGSVAQHGAAAGADVISQAGLGHPSYHQPGPDTAPGQQPGRHPRPRHHHGPTGNTAPESSPSAGAAAPPGPSPDHGQQQRGSERTTHPTPPPTPSPPAAPATATSAGSPAGPGGTGAAGQPSPAEVQAAAEEGAFLA
jgi:hypothetical protein